jgi:hypothetical protein
VVYGLIILQSGIAQAQLLFQLIALASAVSIVLHSSTDVLIADWSRDRRDRAEADAQRRP